MLSFWTRLVIAFRYSARFLFFVIFLTTIRNAFGQPSSALWFEEGVAGSKLVRANYEEIVDKWRKHLDAARKRPVFDAKDDNYEVRNLKQAGKVSLVLHCRNKSVQTKAIKDFQDKLVAAKQDVWNLPYHTPPVKWPGKIEVGFAGRLISKDVKVVQITSSSSFLGTSVEKLLLFRGFDTSALTDNSMTIIDEFIYVPKTETYQTALGTNTVFVIEPLPHDELQRLEAPITDEIRFPKTYRNWQDVSGKFEIEAALISFEDNTATLHKRDKTIVNIPVAKLSVTDRKYVIENLGPE